MLKKHWKLLILAAIILALGVYALQNRPTHKTASMSVCTLEGKSAWLEVDITYYPNFFLPDYVKGTVTLDGVEYVDAYTTFSPSRDSVYPQNWWKSSWSGLYNTNFCKVPDRDMKDPIEAFQYAHSNMIYGLPPEAWEGQKGFTLMCSDESFEDDETGSRIYYGPAANAEEANALLEQMKAEWQAEQEKQ